MSTDDTTTTTTETESHTTTNSSDLEAYHGLHAFERDCLHAIHAVQADPDEAESYGLAIKRRLEAWHGEPVNHGRLYPNLDDLVELGLVEKSELDKRTNQYELTEEGHDAVLGRLEWMLSKFVTGDDRADEVRDAVDVQL